MVPCPKWPVPRRNWYCQVYHVTRSRRGANQINAHRGTKIEKGTSINRCKRTPIPICEGDFLWELAESVFSLLMNIYITNLFISILIWYKLLFPLPLDHSSWNEILVDHTEKSFLTFLRPLSASEYLYTCRPSYHGFILLCITSMRIYLLSFPRGSLFLFQGGWIMCLLFSSKLVWALSHGAC